MTDSSTPEPDYLEEAAAQLRLARAANEARAGTGRSWLTEADVPVLREVNDRRIRIAEGFIALAAIAEGMVTPDASYDVGVALQRPFPEYRDDREPGS